MRYHGKLLLLCFPRGHGSDLRNAEILLLLCPNWSWKLLPLKLGHLWWRCKGQFVFSLCKEGTLRFQLHSFISGCHSSFFSILGFQRFSNIRDIWMLKDCSWLLLHDGTSARFHDSCVSAESKNHLPVWTAIMWMEGRLYVSSLQVSTSTG